MRDAAGIDLGGTFVKFALVSEQGEILFEGKLSIGGKATREDTLSTLKKAIYQVKQNADNAGLTLTGIGIGSPGIVYEGVVIGGADNLDRWENIDLSGIFSAEFGLPVLADNDANVMGLGEVAFGAASQCTDVIFLTVGTGIGGAIVMNGILYGGYKNHGAELGHIAIDHNGIECSCGGKGCLEAYASTNALIARFAQLAGIDADQVDGYHIVRKFREGDPAAMTAMREHTDYLGHGVASFINTFAPQKVVIGGGISEAGQFYINMIKKAAFRYAMPACSKYTDVVAASLGNRAGCLGAASLIFTNIK